MPLRARAVMLSKLVSVRRRWHPSARRLPDARRWVTATVVHLAVTLPPFTLLVVAGRDPCICIASCLPPFTLLVVAGRDPCICIASCLPPFTLLVVAGRDPCICIASCHGPVIGPLTPTRRCVPGYACHHPVVLGLHIGIHLLHLTAQHAVSLRPGPVVVPRLHGAMLPV